MELVYAYNRRRDYPLVDNKIRCKLLLEDQGVAVAPTVAVCEGLFAIPKVMEVLGKRGDFVIKPANGSGGDGILVVNERTEGRWTTASGTVISATELRQHLANIVFGAFSKQLEDQAFVEERLVPHPFFAELYGRGVCDIRLLFLRGHSLMAMVRVPTRRSNGRANLHQGGIGVAVDLESGRTTHAMRFGVAVEKHPENGVPLLGITLPMWPETIELARRASQCVPLGYVGVDIVIDEALGPLVLELNARPGLEIQNVNGRPLGPVVEALSL